MRFEDKNDKLLLHPAVTFYPPTALSSDLWVAYHSSTGKQFFLSSKAIFISLWCHCSISKYKTLAHLSNVLGTKINQTEVALENLKKNKIIDFESNLKSSSYQKLRKEWSQFGWIEAAEYYLLIRKIGFVDYSSDGCVIDNRRMEEYTINSSEPKQIKTYPNAIQRFPLPQPLSSLAPIPFLEFLQGIPRPCPLTWEPLSKIISLVFSRLDSRGHRSYPSNGARYPTESYLFTTKIEGILSGCYHVDTVAPQLELIKREEIAGEIAPFFSELRNDISDEPCAIILLTSVVGRSMYRYREPRTFTTLLIEAGHVIANLEMLCKAFGWQTTIRICPNNEAISQKLRLKHFEEEIISSILITNNNKKKYSHCHKREIGHSHKNVLGSTTDWSTISKHILKRGAKKSSSNMASTHWIQTTAIRPSLNSSSDSLIVSNAILGRRVSISAQSLLDFLSASIKQEKCNHQVLYSFFKNGFIGLRKKPTKIFNPMKHWYQYAWGRCLEYMLWCRQHQNYNARQQQRNGFETPLQVDNYFVNRSSVIKDINLGQLLTSRRTIRNYSKGTVDKRVLLMLLREAFRPPFYSGSGQSTNITFGTHGGEVNIDILVCIYSMVGLKPGLYLFNKRRNSLQLRKTGIFKSRMTHVLSSQANLENALFTFILIANLKLQQKACSYELGLLNLFVDAGRLAQKVIVAAGAFDLGCLTTHGLNLSKLEQLFSTNYLVEYPIYSITMGLNRK